VIHDGAVEQLGTPTEILDKPKTEFVARFLGEVSVFPALVHNGVARAGALQVKLSEPQRAAEVQLVVRSYDLKLWREDPGVATVQRMVTLGDRVRVYAEVDGAGPIVAQFPRRSSLLKGVQPGSRVQLEITTARAYPAG
jgi:ABC-type sulfate/molybdate transport systems ATPase subunit